MKKKGLILLLVMVVVSIPSLIWAYQWSRLGTAPLMSSIEDKISLQENFSSYRKDVIEGLNLAESSWNANEVFDSLEKCVRSDRGVMETFFNPGQKFRWMIFKPKGRVGVVRDVEWTGKERLEGFLITCVFRDSELKFFLVKKCGNIALLEKKILSLAPPPPTEVHVHHYPPLPPPPPVVFYFLLPPPPPFPLFFYYEYPYYQPRYYQPRYHSPAYYPSRHSHGRTR